MAASGQVRAYSVEGKHMQPQAVFLPGTGGDPGFIADGTAESARAIRAHLS